MYHSYILVSLHDKSDHWWFFATTEAVCAFMVLSLLAVMKESPGKSSHNHSSVEKSSPGTETIILILLRNQISIFNWTMKLQKGESVFFKELVTNEQARKLKPSVDFVQPISTSDPMSQTLAKLHPFVHLPIFPKPERYSSQAYHLALWQKKQKSIMSAKATTPEGPRSMRLGD